jgi:hypothetical protein
MASVAVCMTGGHAHTGFACAAGEIELDGDRRLCRRFVEEFLQRVSSRADLDPPHLTERASRASRYCGLACPAEGRRRVRDELVDRHRD